MFTHAGAGSLQRTVHGVDGVAERLRHFFRRPPEHIAQDQHGARSRSEMLDCDHVRQLDGLPRHGDAFRLVYLAGGQLVEQPIRVGLQPQHLAPAGGLRPTFGEQVETSVGGDPIQPRSKRRPALERLPPTPGTQESFLHGVFGVLEGPEHPIAVDMKLTPVPLGCRRERRLGYVAQVVHVELLDLHVRAHHAILPSFRGLVAHMTPTRAATHHCAGESTDRRGSSTSEPRLRRTRSRLDGASVRDAH